MKLKKLILLIAVIIVLATVGLVVADEAGIFTINIFNSPNGQIYTDISNSTIQGETNYTNSQAYQNITLTNSTLTLNINGQNITITSEGNGLVITGPNQNSTTTPSPKPTLSVAFLKSGPNQHNIIVSDNTTIQYDFNITVTVPTSMNYPFGKNATHEKISQALAPLATKYNLVTNNYNGNGTITSAQWVDMPIVDGENTFSLFSYNALSADQIKSLTMDLFNAFTIAMQG
jgi:hypothetical protein